MKNVRNFSLVRNLETPFLTWMCWCIFRPITPEIDDEGFARDKYGYKSYSNAIAANAQKSSLQKKKEQYASTALTGRRYDSDEDAEFEPEVQTSQRDPAPARKTSGSSVKEDEWSQLAPQTTTGKPAASGGSDYYADEELAQLDRQSESSGERNRKVGTWFSVHELLGGNAP